MKDPLTILATTKNYNSGDESSAFRIIQIYQKLKQEKTLSAEEVELLLREALTLKKTPEKEIESLLFSQHISLFCFPYAGGSASFYKNWSSELPHAIKVVGMEYPGRGEKENETLLKVFDVLLSHLEKEILSKIKGPFAFFGHSLGAIIAFELARLLQDKHGLQPAALFLSGCPSPDIISLFSSMNEMKDESFIQSLEDLNGTPQGLMELAEFREFFLPILRADFSLLDSYVPAQMRVKFPLVIFGGKQDPKVNIEDLSKWSFWTESSMSLIKLEGDHFFIRQPKLVLNVIAENLCPKLF